MVTGTVPIQAIFKNDGFPTSSSDIHARQTIVPAQLFKTMADRHTA
jgi:hypothetical protein